MQISKENLKSKGVKDREEKKSKNTDSDRDKRRHRKY